MALALATASLRYNRLCTSKGGGIAHCCLLLLIDPSLTINTSHRNTMFCVCNVSANNLKKQTSPVALMQGFLHTATGGTNSIDFFKESACNHKNHKGSKTCHRRLMNHQSRMQAAHLIARMSQSTSSGFIANGPCLGKLKS